LVPGDFLYVDFIVPLFPVEPPDLIGDFFDVIVDGETL
jgi:hypothetical protein